MDKLEYLKKVISQTGYPLEIQISSILDKNWEIVLNTDSYFDREEQKLRDIDIVTYNNYLDKNNDTNTDLTLTTGMIIECKKSENSAWVFFSRPFDFSANDIVGTYLDKVQCLTRNLDKNNFLFDLVFGDNLHYSNFKRVAVAYSEFLLNHNSQSRNERNKREIFEAQNQIKKYIDYSFEQFINDTNHDKTQVYFYFPCIVFDGDLFEAIVDGDKIELKETDHLILSTNYKSPLAIFERSLLIDIVRKTYFDTYLKEILKDRQELESYFHVSADQLLYRIQDVLEYFPKK